MKKTVLALVVIFIAIQLIPFDVPATVPSDKSLEIQAPDNVKQILKRSCYDCHSNTTHFPWYSSIAPVSWFTKYHVKEGRAHMNFSLWGKYPDEKKLKYLQKIPKAIKSKMPLPSYLIMHQDAKLSDADKKAIEDWTTEAAFDLE